MAEGEGSGEKLLWENMWDSLDLEDLPESEEKLGKKVHDGKGSGGEGGGGGERVLWKNMWDSLDLDDWDSLDWYDSTESEEKLGKKVVDGNGSGGEGGGGRGSEKVLRENVRNSLDLADLLGIEKKIGEEGTNGKESSGEGEEGAAPPTKKRGHKKGNESIGEGGEGATPPTKKQQSSQKKYMDKLKSMFANLLALLPEPRAEKVKSKAAVMVQAEKHIQTLQRTLQSLETQKLERVQGGFGPSIITSQKLLYNPREAFLVDQGSLNNLAITKTSSSNSPSHLQYPVVFQTWIFSNVVLNICGNEAQISVCSAKKPGLLTNIWCALEKHKTEVVSAHIISDCNRSIYMIQAHVTGASDLGIEIYKQAAKEIMLCFSP